MHSEPLVHKTSFVLYRDWDQRRQYSRDSYHGKAAAVEINRPVTRVPVDSSGTHLSIRRYAGKGPALVMIHGITSSSADFDQVATRLTDISTPIAIDLRGHGSSDKPGRGYHYSDYVQDLTAVIRELRLDHPIVLGHSLGGIITMFWAAENPGVARGLVIEDAPLRSGEEFRDAFKGWLYLNDLPESELRQWYSQHNPEMTEDVRDYRTHSMLATRREAITELYAASMANQGLDTADSLSRITDQMLFLHGDSEQGSMVHPDDLRSLPTVIRNVKVREIHGAGHSPHRSHTNEWLHHVRKFLSGLND